MSPDFGRSCSVKDCGKPLHARSLCRTHYTRWLRNGDPTVVRNRYDGYVPQIRHGTCSGARKCRQLPEGACVDCRHACAEYMRQRRSSGVA